MQGMETSEFLATLNDVYTAERQRLQELPLAFGRMRGSAEISGDVVAPVGEKWSVDE